MIVLNYNPIIVLYLRFRTNTPQENMFFHVFFIRAEIFTKVQSNGLLCRFHTMATSLRINSQSSLSAVSVESPWCLHLQKICNTLQLYGDCTMYRDSADIAQRILRS